MAVEGVLRSSAAMAPAAIRLEGRRRRRWRRDRWGSRAVEALGMPHEEAAVGLHPRRLDCLMIELPYSTRPRIGQSPELKSSPLLLRLRRMKAPTRGVYVRSHAFRLTCSLRECRLASVTMMRTMRL